MHISQTKLTTRRVQEILVAARQCRIFVAGDVMLDQFIWGEVSRISPEAPVPIVEFVRESFMPGGAANVARNLTALEVPTELSGVIGTDLPAQQLKELLKAHHIDSRGLISAESRRTSLKTRIVPHKQQVVRIDRETREGLNTALEGRIIRRL